MTHAELYEIVKDHPDVWGHHFIVEDYGGGLRRFVRHFTHQAEECEHAEMELLGLGVAWLVENGRSARIYPPLPMRQEYFVGTDDCGDWQLPSLLASVYAAIAEVKAKA